MKRHFILLWALKIPADILIVISSFFLAREIRLVTDLIPNVQLPIKSISTEDLFLFAITWAVLFVSIIAGKWLYKIKIGHNLIEELIGFIQWAFLWILLYIGFVYLATGFIFHKEIPRLIILFGWIITLVLSVWFRIIYHYAYKKILTHWKFDPQVLVVITDNPDSESVDIIRKSDAYSIKYIIANNPESYKPNSPYEFRTYTNLLTLIRTRSIDEILYIDGNFTTSQIQELIHLSKIYWIVFAYTTNIFKTEPLFQHATHIHSLPVIEIRSVGISPGERIYKRIIDIIGSFFGLIILAPLFLLIAIAIKIEDPSGPIIFRNRRVWLQGKEFFLYKFRYMYWKYCVKDAYGVKENEDSALQFEESLKKEHDSRNGPLYKIENDPRKMRIGKILEKLSLDELPQLMNVLLGNMSLIGPRPHQPREVEKYEEYQYQVLTVKPWMTGMAQVHGREKNSFDEEVRLDTHYIEHYSLWIDLEILIRTGAIVIKRALGIH